MDSCIIDSLDFCVFVLSATFLQGSYLLLLKDATNATLRAAQACLKWVHRLMSQFCNKHFVAPLKVVLGRPFE